MSIPKCGRNSYSIPRDYRPTSLTSFLLNPTERLMDRYLRDEALALMPLHPTQHAYQAGKSVETALHQLTVWAEKALDQQETALGVFLEREGALSNTCYDTMYDAVFRHGITLLYIGLGPPWRATLLWRPSMDFP